MILLDTHVVIWLYTGARHLFPDGVRELIERSDVAISPIVILELAYLGEIGRLRVDADTVVSDLIGRIGLSVASAPFAQVCREALRLQWTRDPFDRIQAGQAIAEDAPLLTKDRTILDHLPLATWPE